MRPTAFCMVPFFLLSLVLSLGVVVAERNAGAYSVGITYANVVAGYANGDTGESYNNNVNFNPTSGNLEGHTSIGRNGSAETASSKASYAALAALDHLAISSQVSAGQVNSLTLGSSFAVSTLAVTSSDTFFVVGNGAPNVSWVDYRLTYHLNAPYGGFLPSSPESIVIAQIQQNGLPQPLSQLNVTPGSDGFGFPILSEESLFSAPVGSFFTLTNYLSVGNHIGGTCYAGICTSGSEFGFHTINAQAYFTLEALTKGGGFISESGQLYALAPVPLPGALLLFGAGLACLAGFGRLKSRIKN